MKLEGIILTILVLAVLSIPYVSGASSIYEFQGFNSFFSLGDEAIGFNYTGTCQIGFQTLASYNISTAFNTIASWSVPTSTIIATSPTIAVLNDVTDLNYGETGFISANKESNGLYENLVGISQSALSGYITTSSRYSCPSNTEFVNFTITPVDNSQGNCLYKNAEGGGNLTTTFRDIFSSNYALTGDLTQFLTDECTFVAGANSIDHTAFYYYPFNSSSGTVLYSFTDGSVVFNEIASAIFVEYSIDLFNARTRTFTNIFQDSKAVNSGVPTDLDDVSGTLTLERDTDYAMIITIIKDHQGAGTSSIT